MSPGEAMVMNNPKTASHNGVRKPLRVLSRPQSWGAVVLAPLLASACVSPLVQNAPSALQTAETRARFELNCPNITASILSQKIVHLPLTEGTEHTIGVRGCGKEAVYVTYCRDPNDCNALSQTGRITEMGNTAPGVGP